MATSPVNSVAAGTDGEVVENNRLANKNEKEIINNLTDIAHDRQKLEAASCALIKCYAEYPVGSVEYEKNLALAQEGEKYQKEQQLLKNYELLTTELQDPLYWNKVPEEVKAKYQGFEYSDADKIADGQKAYDAWKIGYIADKLGVSPGVVELTSSGFNVGLIVSATSQAGKIVGSNIGGKSDSSAPVENNGVINKANSTGSTSIVPRKASNLSGGPLENAQQVSGRFKIEGGPKNGTVYRADNQGNITSYAVYDAQGMITKRVDVTGAAHGGVSTPHVIEYGRNTLPNGQIRVQTPSTKELPRPVKQDEIP